MIDEQKLSKLLELKTQRDAIDAEITALLGGERPKRTWSRRTKVPDQEKNPA